MGLFDKAKKKFNSFMYEGDDVEVSDSDLKEEGQDETENKETVNKDEGIITERDLFKTDPKFKFPINFEEEEVYEEEPIKQESEKYQVKETKTIVETKNVFRPTPVISPIYGILDKNYKKGDIVDKGSGIVDANGKLDVDSVIRKAYGEVEITKTVTREEKFYTIDEKEEMKEIVEAEINLFETLKEDVKEIPKEEVKPLSRVEINETDYEEESYDIDEIDNKIKSIDQLLKETSDDDFYSLVDSMYKDEEEEE